MPPTDKRPSRLGRGLSSLMSQSVAVSPPGESTPTKAGPTKMASSDRSTDVPRGTSDAEGEMVWISLDQIIPNTNQPRQHFSENALQELADSIKQHGVMQPVIVRGRGKGGYELVAGERRWRAAGLAGLDKLPAVLRQIDDQESAEWALIENLQREDLNPIERAEAFKQLADRFGLAHEQVASRVGLERSTVTNLLRLLKLATDVRQLVADDLLSMGHARALAGVSDPALQSRLAAQSVREGWSVRQTEAAAKRMSNQSSDDKPNEKATGPTKSAWLSDLERQLSEQLGTRVQIKPGKKKGVGRLSIEYHSLDAFDGLLDRLGIHSEK